MELRLAQERLLRLVQAAVQRVEVQEALRCPSCTVGVVAVWRQAVLQELALEEWEALVLLLLLRERGRFAGFRVSFRRQQRLEQLLSQKREQRLRLERRGQLLEQLLEQQLLELLLSLELPS